MDVEINMDNIEDKTSLDRKKKYILTAAICLAGLALVSIWTKYPFLCMFLKIVINFISDDNIIIIVKNALKSHFTHCQFYHYFMQDMILCVI